MAAAPTRVDGPVQYGPGVRAVATYLLAPQHLPLARTAALLSDGHMKVLDSGTGAGTTIGASSGEVQTGGQHRHPQRLPRLTGPAASHPTSPLWSSRTCVATTDEG